MKVWKKLTAACLTLLLALSAAGCETAGTAAPQDGGTAEADGTPVEETAEPVVQEEDPAPAAEKNGDVYILFTSDVHCGVEQGFGYVGLKQVRDSLEAQGYTTLLVDDGDSIQGETIGTLTKGEADIELMNAMGYDVAIPGNHEFDYGMDRFLELAEMAAFPYISCNFNREGELVFPAYTIQEAAGMKIAFVGVTTPQTITSSTPAYFQNEDGEFIYGFMQDESGDLLYQAVQDAVDAARAEGADYVYVMGHLGMEEAASPWTYADVISHTTGIDVFLDGHSHDTEQVVMQNLNGEDVVRSACGTKLNCIGYSHISAQDGIAETNIWSWPMSISAPVFFNLQNDMTAVVRSAVDEVSAQMEEVVAASEVELTIFDPEAVDDSGNKIRTVRRAETNLGDFCADALRVQSGADVAFMNGGGIRTNIEQGDVTYGEIINVFPFGNMLCVLEVTGQQILDALEWGARAVPQESGGFLHVSGMSYEIDASIPSGCIVDENSMCAGIEGARRVSNVYVGGEPLDPDRTYTLGGINYTLLQNGDGYTAFDGATVLQENTKIDNQLLIDYIVEDLGGVIGAEYENPYGQGRITITGAEN